MANKKVETRLWDPAEHLETDEEIAAYLDAALEDGDPTLIVAVLGDIARARGMTQLARKGGVGLPLLPAVPGALMEGRQPAAASGPWRVSMRASTGPSACLA